ncbi:hypothetical protein ABTN50_19320, partial [Acinetobacter baumannii]
YDGAGNLASAHNTGNGLSSRYGYSAADPHRLIVATSPTGAAGSVISYGTIAQVAPLTADLHGPSDFGASPYQGSLSAGGTDYLSFNLRPS